MRSLKLKLLVWVLPLCLLPLVGISAFSYFVAKQRITEDRIVLYLEQIAQDVADTLHLTFLEKKEETVSMSLYGEFREVFSRSDYEDEAVLLLNKLVLVHEVYDLLILFDPEGRIVLTNSMSRNSTADRIHYLDEGERQRLKGLSLLLFTPDSEWLQQVRSSRFGYLNWHRSPLVQRLYDYENADIARQYSIGFAAPVLDRRNMVVGGILALMNWQFVQEILDKVEADLEERSLSSGYAFLIGDDYNTVVGHKYRRNRGYSSTETRDLTVLANNYGTRLVEDHDLQGLHQALLDGRLSFEYAYPAGNAKISGLAPVNHEYFQWICGVGIDNQDIFAPVQALKRILVGAASMTAVLVFLLTYSVARRITVPVKKLTRGARVISGGDFSQRVAVDGSDEIAELATTFNEMAQSLEERSQALTELNRSLEEKVAERTRELEKTNQEVQKAYQELKETQSQLVQSEKMASLGQLMAGIAHEIKNPLNFIYGNTDFLHDYLQKLQQLVALLEQNARLDGQEKEKVEKFKRDINYQFMLEDLETLVENFEEGARRIHSIVGDLRTFSRMDSEELQSVDIHDTIELALNLLKNECRGRIEVRRRYGDLPKLICHPGRMNQVFMNLLANACQAIPEAGCIEVRTFCRNGQAVIEIEDNGEGIPAEHLERVFEPFFTTKPVGKGTGLGLSISYAIVRQHQGVLEVESEQGKGSVFRMKLPITPAPDLIQASELEGVN